MYTNIEESEMFSKVDEEVIQVVIEQLVKIEIVDRFSSQERYNKRPDRAMYAMYYDDFEKVYESKVHPVDYTKL